MPDKRGFKQLLHQHALVLDLIFQWKKENTLSLVFVLMSVFLRYCFIQQISVQAVKSVVKPMGFYSLNKGGILHTLFSQGRTFGVI